MAQVKRFLVLFVFVFIFKALIFALSFGTLESAESVSLCQWDCGYYQSIATQGYVQQRAHEFAFFPGFPMLMSLFYTSGGSFLWVSLVNLLLASIGYVFLFLWVECLGADLKKIAGLVLLFTLVDRFTFWAFIPYTESLFFCLSFMSLYLLRRPSQRMLGLIIAGLASGVRVVGVARGLGVFVYEYWNTRRFVKSSGIALVSILGFLAYMIFMHQKTGDALAFLRAQNHWGRDTEGASILSSLWSFLRSFYWPSVLTMILTFYGLFRLKGLNLDERIFMALMIVIPMSTSSGALTRFVSLVPVGYIVLAQGLIRIPKLKIFLLTLWCLSEIYWQIHLAQKYFKGEYFKWIG